jgi:endonuclease/exonuclease/phosphatase family metal-dependent hydrolase
VTVRYEFSDPQNYRIRTYRGRLVEAKDADDTDTIAQRNITMDVDVLAVQEVENIDVLRQFNRENLGGLYPYQVLIEGNDPRLIDVGVLSKLPIGAITSFQTAVHDERPNITVFGRDLLEVEILNATRSRKLFTLYNNHLKSHYGDDENGGQGRVDNDTRRRQQAEMIAEIVADRTRPNSKYVITGDMNDPPAAAPLHAMLPIEGNQLVDGLAQPQETRPAKAEAGGHDPQSPRWTHRFKPTGQPPEHELFDQIWLSPSLAPALQGAFIDRRTKHGGDGSDHDPAWVVLDL